jgi:UDP-glucose 4-epimerase
MKLAPKRILVTGGAGFIGSHLVDTLIREGCFVRVIDNFVNGKMENLAPHKAAGPFELIRGDITKRAAVANAMKDIDIVFHLACLGVRHSLKYPFENHRVNAEGTLIVLQEARRAKVKKFVYCSSSEVYGTAQVVPMRETHPTLPCTVYGAGKLAGEAYARAFHRSHGFPTVIVRPFNTYGPRSHYEGDAGELIPKSIVRALNGRPILVFGDGRQTRDFTYVEDTAEAIAESAKCDAMVGQTYNIGSRFEISIKEIAEKILKECGNRSARIRYLRGRPGDVLRLFADANSFGRLAHWKPTVPLDEGLRRTIAWFRSRADRLPAMLREEKGRNWE